MVWLVEGCARAAKSVLAGTVLLTAALLYYAATHLALDTNTINMLDPKLRFRQLDEDFERAFPQLSDLIIVVIDAETAPRADDLASELARRLRSHPERFRSVYEPTGGGFFAHNGLLYLGTTELQDLADRLAEAQPLLGTLAEDPSLRGLFSMLGHAFDEKLSPNNEAVLKRFLDGISRTLEDQLAGRPSPISWRQELLASTTLGTRSPRSFLLVQPRLDYTHLQPSREALETIRTLARQLALDPSRGERVRLTGSLAMEDEELGSVLQGAKLSSFLSFTLVLLLTVFGLRSPRQVVAILLTLGVGLVWTGAFAAFAIGALNLISVNFAVLFIGMGVDFGIQFGLRYKEELGRGCSHRVALVQASAGIGGALTLAAVAAAAAFFAFMPTSYWGLAELGLIAGVSMFVALLANLTVLPALLSVIPMWLEFKAPPAGGVLRFPHLWVGRYPRTILAVTALLFAGAALLAPRVRFDFNPLNMKDPTTESVATFLDLLRDPNLTPYTISVLAESLPAAKALAPRLERLALVDKAVTLASFIPAEQDEKLAIIDELTLTLGPLIAVSQPKATPSLQEEIQALGAFERKLKGAGVLTQNRAFAESLRRFERALAQLKRTPGWPMQAVPAFRQQVLADLPQTLERLRQLLTPSPITLNTIPKELKARYLARDGRARIEVFPKEDVRDNRALRRFVQAVQSVAPNATDTPVSLVAAGDVVIRASLEAAGWALLATFFLLLGVLRSLFDTCLVFVPVGLAVVFTLASAVLLQLPLDFANIIALPLLLAINNAYGIYLVMRVRDGLDVNRLFQSSTPRAVLFSAATMMASFGTLAFAHHRGMSGMGLLVTLALSYAVLCTLVVLPALLGVLEARHRRRRAEKKGELHRVALRGYQGDGDPP